MDILLLPLCPIHPEPIPLKYLTNDLHIAKQVVIFAFIVFVWPLNNIQPYNQPLLCGKHSFLLCLRCQLCYSIICGGCYVRWGSQHWTSLSSSLSFLVSSIPTNHLQAKNSQMYVSNPNLSSESQTHRSNFLSDSPLNFSHELDMLQTEFFVPLHSHFSKCNQ